MKTRSFVLVAVALLTGALAASCGGNGNGTDGGGGSGGGGTGGGGGGGGGGVTAECDKPANVQHAQALQAAQPAFEVRSKALITQQVTFASLADDASVTCSVSLQFKDSNGNTSLDPYEDWRKTADERAADLLGRMTADQKMALLAHPTLPDEPSGNGTPSATVQGFITAGVRFGLTDAPASSLGSRALWANAIQTQCEASALGIPFVLSMNPAHSSSNGRVRARGFSQWPSEAGLAASRDPALLEQFGKIVSQEYRAIGVRLALSPSADLYTEPRWFDGQFTFGENATLAGSLVKAFVKGAQGAALGPDSVACVVGHFPGAGPAKGGWDARLEKGQYVTYPANALGTHLAPFAGAFDQGVAGVMPAYAIAEAGTWSALGGLLDGTTYEQVGAAFNQALLTDVLRDHYAFHGLVLAPWGALENTGLSPLGAPWGVASLSRAQRLAKAVNAGVDQFGGLDGPALVQEARAASLITDAQVDAAAGHALALMFRLGLFEDPYVDPSQAPALCNTDAAYRAGLDAMNRGTVLVVNVDKPLNWLNGAGDGTQVGDKGNAGNGTLKVLPAPPGEPYVSAGCSYFILGDFDLDYVRSVSAGYGELTNDATVIKGIPVTTAAQRIALSDYVFVRIASPFTVDPDSGALHTPLQPLSWAQNANAHALDPVATARAAIDAWTGEPASKTQLVVAVDSGRVPILSEVLAFNPSAVYVSWNGTLPDNPYADKVLLDVAFGIVNGVGKLPVGLPLSEEAASSQKEDQPNDGQHPTFVEGFGLDTPRFE